jgi:hypothetical protein
MKKKHYVFRPYGQDEGDAAPLTAEEADQIQDSIDALTTDELRPPYYIYEMDSGTAARINETLDEEAKNMEAR